VDQHLLFIDGEQAATVVRMENATGWYWAWSGFYRGRFGGPDNIEHPTIEMAKAAARKWLDELVVGRAASP
jgi:hypothetical protein